MTHCIVAYVPVLHEGYYRFFTHYPQVSCLYLVPPDLAARYTPTHKEIRALDIQHIQRAIQSWEVFPTVSIATEQALRELNTASCTVYIPAETVSQQLAADFFPQACITPTSIFLRWDRASATATYAPSALPITLDPSAQPWMQEAYSEGALSSDWWRQVGAVAVRDAQLLLKAHNTHLPHEQQPYSEGDPRAHFHQGDHIEFTTAIHAEALLIARAARSGISLEGADLYVTDFPCPPCAKLIAQAGIINLFYHKGYAVLDGEQILKTAGVQLHRWTLP